MKTTIRLRASRCLLFIAFTCALVYSLSDTRGEEALPIVEGGAQPKHNFPHYFEIDVGETVNLEGYPPIQLLEKRVTAMVNDNIGAAEVTVKVGEDQVVVPVGYEFDDVAIGDVRIGADVISDYHQDRPNRRYRLSKDARLRVARAGQPLTARGSHVFPLPSPWNGGGQKLSWLTLSSRYHDGWDFGSWEGELAYAVCDGIVVSPDDYPEILKQGAIYNQNKAKIGTNPFLIKDADLPVLYFYTHLSGLARDFQVGDRVKKGQIVAYTGDRGSSGGWHHLHFGIVLIDQAVCVNPYPFIRQWYHESMPYYLDFLSDFEVYLPKDDDTASTLGQDVLAGHRATDWTYHNSLPGAILLKDALVPIPYVRGRDEFWKTPIYETPRFAVLTTRFTSPEDMDGELWLGHTGVLTVHLNGKQVYTGEDPTPYVFGDGSQPFQWDRHKLLCHFKQGTNKLLLVVQKLDRTWAFTIRPRTRLGVPLPKQGAVE